MYNFTADDENRLDIFLASKLEKSRSQVSLLIKDGYVKVNDKTQDKASFKLKANDTISLILPQIKSTANEYELNFEINILFEDEDILVLDKPSGLVVHEASSVKEATLVSWLKSKNYTLSSLNGLERAGLVHRLDKGTSGAIIIAKNNFSHQALSKQLEDKTMGRFYLALTDLPLKEDTMLVQKALTRSPNNRLKKMAIKDEEKLKFKGYKEAKTAFVNLLLSKQANLIAAKLFTGRTHQIRAHLESLNRHILGDELYGYKGKDFKRVMLHAYCVYFIHPRSKELLFVKAPLHKDLDIILQNNFTLGEINEKISLEYLRSCFSTFI